MSTGGSLCGEERVTWASAAVNVKNPKYGFVKGADNTKTIEDAYWEAHNSGKALYLPPDTYNYNGAGLGGINPVIRGAGRTRTTINLGPSSRLFDTTGTLGSLHFADFSTTGGLGVFRSTNEGNNVGNIYLMSNLHFKGYTATAVENNAADMPHWKFRDIMFDAANSTTTMGIALSGLTDGCSFENLEFMRNRVHIKIRAGANSAYIRSCNFIRWDGYTTAPRVDLWIVPNPSSVNAGVGFNLTSSKFGAENVHAQDKRIVYANEGAGATNGERFPDLTTASTGHVHGHYINGIMLGNITNGNPPLVYSTTPNVRDCTYANINIAGTVPEYIVEFLTPLTAERANTNSIIGPLTGIGLAVDGAPAPRASNAANFAHIVDPQGFLAASPGAISAYQAGDPVGYKSLVRTPTQAYNSLGNITTTTVADRFGGTDARNASRTATGQAYIQVSIPNSTTTILPGKPAWIEFDAKSSNMASIRARIAQSGGTIFHFSRSIRLGADWHRYKFSWTPRPIEGSQHLIFEHTGDVGGEFTVGRVRIYHAQEPLNVDGLTVIDGAVYRLTMTDGVLGAIPLTSA